MESLIVRSDTKRSRGPALSTTKPSHWTAEHFFRLMWHRKVVVLGIFLVVSSLTAVVATRLPNFYTSETLILVDPQKVPDAYIRSTVTGDVRNRLGTLSQQILSATRLQRIIETLGLYPEERKTLAREEVITRMRKDINVRLLSDFGTNQDLQAFRITYSGRNPQLVARVANELAALFIAENLRAREQQATGTTEFLENQLEETRKALEGQEAKLRDFKLRHIGSMPQQETASLQILGQLQSQLQLESDALARSEQQKSYLQSMIAAAPPPVVDLDSDEPRPSTTEKAPAVTAPGAPSALDRMKERLRTLQLRYSDQHPDVKKVLRQIEEEQARQVAEKRQPAVEAAVERPAEPPAEPPARRRPARIPPAYTNPVLESQLRSVDAEIEQHKRERERLAKLAASYQDKLAAIPVNEQRVTALERDYEISKAHYKELLAKQLSAETATQLEVRQKGEKFSVLDPAQPAGRPSWPNRILINLVGCVAGLVFGVVAALMPEIIRSSITGHEQLTSATATVVLEVIPMIQTHAARESKRRYAIVAAALAMCVSCLGAYGYLFYRH